MGGGERDPKTDCLYQAEEKKKGGENLGPRNLKEKLP